MSVAAEPRERSQSRASGLSDALDQPLPFGLDRGKRWKDGLFDCMDDVPSCLYGCCCPCIPIAQLYEKMLGPKGRCVIVAVILLVFNFGIYVFSQAYYTNLPKACLTDAIHKDETDMSKDCARHPGGLEIHNLFVALYVLSSSYLLCRIRGTVRGLYGIPEGTCGTMEDCCCSFWCLHCALCQTMRHVYAYDKTGGSAWNMTSTGDPSDVDLHFVYATPKTTAVPHNFPSEL